MKNIQYYIWKSKSIALSALLIILISFIFPTNTLNAQVTIKEQAKILAEQFLKIQNLDKSSFSIQSDTTSTLTLEEIYLSPDSAVNKLYGFKNDQLGFVFILENNDIFLVVGYSENGYYDSNNIPDALNALLKTYEQANELTSAPLFKSGSATSVVEPLLDKEGISLNQFYHEDAGNCPSGCVVTAMAQIMAYYKYPDSGIGSNCYTHPTYGEFCADFENTTYNWDNPTDDDYKLLSFHLGVSMNMNYCGDQYGSIPEVWEYPEVLQKNFKYYTHSGSSESFYLINELDNNRPIYCELPGDPGHAVVLDGYDINEFFHINFGWGGAYNGYFMLNNNSLFDVSVYTFGSNVNSFNSSIFISPTPFRTNSQDSLALVSFHNSMNAETGWDLTRPVVEWKGVVVMNERVISLKLTRGLEGEIPDDIGNLTALQNFNITGLFSGSFPMALTNLTSLKELVITNYLNTPSVVLPDEIGNLINLETLGLKKIKGSIPNTIGNLTKLKSLTLSGGELTGEIPDELYSLTNLEELLLGENQLSGNITPEIGQLTKLKVVDLRDNKFTGSLPTEIGNLEELTEFDVSQNQFSSTIPETIGNWTKLVNLSFDNNAFEGMLPNAICRFTEFSALYINNNKFTALPDSIGNLINLQQIIANNNLINTIPTSINKLSKLYRLNLMNNELTTLPDLGTMPALWDLNLSNNQISTLPESFGKLVKVADLHLDNNELKELPSSFENLTTLRLISLSENKLTLLPIKFSFLSNLRFLYLQDNQINEALPQLNHIGLIELWLQGNSLVFSDIAASGMPDDLIYTDDYTFLYYDQAKVDISDSVFYFEDGDNVNLDIRSISRLSHSDNVYQWYKNNEAFQTGAVLQIPSFTSDQKGTYFCRITNPSFKRNTTTLETDPIIISSLDDLYLTEGFSTSSRSIDTHEFTDYRLTLITPEELRGDLKWQASIDSINWFDVSENMTQDQIKQNILSISESNIVVEPKSPVLFRYVVEEGTCDPLISDTIKINPYGNLLIDTVLNIQNEAITISTDSIELVFPPNFSDNEFRLTITKLLNPPTAPDSVSMGSVYDVNVSCGSVFDLPILIKFKNINKSSFNAMEIDRYKAVCFDDKNQQWETYENAQISLIDSTLIFETNHLTKLSWWWDEENFLYGYTDLYVKDKVKVYYKSSHATFFTDYETRLGTLPRHLSPSDPEYGTPVLIQDMAYFCNQVMTKFSTLTLDVPESITIYADDINDAGNVGLMGMIKGYVNLNVVMDSREALMSTIAHEYMHYTQDYYISAHPGNIFWMEANGHTADRMVWNISDLPISESEHFLLESRDKDVSIYNSLAASWDYWDANILTQNALGNMDYCYLAGCFIHFMRSYTVATKLKPEVLLKENTYFGSWKDYLNDYIVKHMNSTIGDQFEAYVKYIFEGTNSKFTLLNTIEDEDPIKYFSKPTAFITNKFIKFNNEKILKDSVQLEIPYLASKMVQLYNMNNNKQVLVKYERKSAKQANMKVYVCNYDSDNKKMIYEDISENDSSVFVIESATPDINERRNVAFLLFINKDKSQDFNVDYDLELYGVPEFSMLDQFSFFAGLYGQTELKIHSITDGTTEKLDEFYLIPQVFRRYADEYYSPLTFTSELDETTITTYASSNHFEQTVTYDYMTGSMTIYNRENWGGTDSISTIDSREITMVLKDIWLVPMGPNSLGLTHSFNTNSTEETKAVIQSITYTRKYALWNEQLTPPAHNPLVTYTYLKTNYPEVSNEWNFIKLRLMFW